MPGKASQVVISEYWMNPLSLKSYDFLISFNSTLRKFGEFVNFKPLYKFKELDLGEFPEHFLKDHCFNKGKYCSLESSNIDSASVLKEGIR